MSDEKYLCPLLTSDSEYERARAALARLMSQDRSWQRRESREYPMGAGLAAAIDGGATWERKEPARPADLAGDVLVPLAQAGVTGLVGGIIGGLVGGLAAGAVVGGLTFSTTWLVLLADHRRSLWLVERLTGRDLDPDGHVGAPARTVRVETIERTRRGGQIRYTDLPVSDEKLKDVARAVLVKHANFSRPGLADVLTQTEYHKLAAAMVKAGLLAELPGNRRELQAAGRILLKRMLEK